MTIIVGIQCEDGIVLGADGGATLGSPGGGTTCMQPMSKIEAIGNTALVAFSGSVGLGQLYIDSIVKTHNDFRTSDCADICRTLRGVLGKDFAAAAANAKVGAPILGAVAAQSSILTTVLLALNCKSGLHLVQFDPFCNPEMASDKLPFVCMGSGQGIADPFLAFLRRIFWNDHRPTLANGIFAVTWALEHAVKIAPGGIAPPISLGILKRDGNSVTTEILNDDLIAEHKENVSCAEDYIRTYRQDQLPNSKASEPPSPPAKALGDTK